MAISKRSEDALAGRIEAVVGRGHAFVEWWELNVWYDAERIGKTIWRDLGDRFDREAENKAAELLFVERPNGVLLIDSRKLKKVSGRIQGVE